MSEAAPLQPVTKDDVLEMCSVKYDTSIQADKDIQQAYLDLVDVRARMQQLKVIEASLVDEIAVFMKDKTMLVDEDGIPIVTWNMSMPSETFNAKRFKAENKELYSRYLDFKPGTRRFLVK